MWGTPSGSESKSHLSAQKRVRKVGHPADLLDQSIGKFAVAYADQSTAGYQQFTKEVIKGRLGVATGVD